MSKMRFGLLFLVCALIVGCSTTRKLAPGTVLRQVDLVLARERDVRRFEGRLDELGAQIEKGANSGEWVATVPLPGKPGYFPPRTLRIVYVITDQGLVVLSSADVTSLGSPFARTMPQGTRIVADMVNQTAKGSFSR